MSALSSAVPGALSTPRGEGGPRSNVAVHPKLRTAWTMF